MARRPRIDEPGDAHHVMNRGTDRGAVFFADRDRIEFGRLLGEVDSMFGIVVIAYCLMGNHYHLVLRCPEGGLSEAMQHLGAVYTRHTNDRIGRDGPLFRGRFHSRPIRTPVYLVNVVRYVHLNPLDIAGVVDADTYRWSSQRTYLGYRRAPNWLNPDETLRYFAQPSDYRRFMGASRSSVTEPVGVNLTDLDAIISLMIKTHAPDELISSRLSRTVEVRLADRLHHTNRELLLDRLEFTSDRSRMEAIRRSRKQAEQAPAIDVIVEEVRRMLFRVSVADDALLLPAA